MESQQANTGRAQPASNEANHVSPKQWQPARGCLAVMSVALPASVLLCNTGTGAVTDFTHLLRSVLVGLDAYKALIDDPVLWGLVMAVVVLGLMWLGVGIMSVALRLRDVALAFVVGFGIIASVSGLIYAYVVGPVFSMSLKTFSEPAQHWQAMEPLPENAVEIASAGPYEVRVRTVSGKVYASTLQYKRPPTPWVEAQGPVARDGSSSKAPIGNTTELPGTPVSTAGILFHPCAECGSQMDYAVLPDGSVWWSLRNFEFPLFGLVGLALVIPKLTIGLLSLFAAAFLGAGIVWGGRAVFK